MEVRLTAANHPGVQKLGRVPSSILIAADGARLKRVLRAREVMAKEELEGFPAHKGTGKVSVWGWVRFRSRLQKDVQRARGRAGEVEVTLSDRRCVVSRWHYSSGDHGNP